MLTILTHIFCKMNLRNRCLRSSSRINSFVASNLNNQTTPTSSATKIFDHEDHVKSCNIKKSLLRTKRKNIKRNATNIKEQRKEGVSSLNELSRKLHASAIPERLSCRDSESDQIMQFISTSIRDKSSRSLYISGVPGTGKTATVLQVVRTILSEKAGLFEFVHVNGMRLAEPTHVFMEILHQIEREKRRGRHVGVTEACRRLNNLFYNKRAKSLPIVLFIDELDLLCTKRQEVLYEIFNWTTLDRSHLIILAIANTLDLPERLLDQRINSRLGMDRLSFRPYTFGQIASIIDDRLDGSSAVDGDAVQFVSRKVAAVTGDVRKALDLVRKAVEMAVRNDHPVLTLQHIHTVLREQTSTARVLLISCQSLQCKFALQACVSALRSSGREQIEFRHIWPVYQLLCSSDSSVQSLSSTALYDCCLRLVNVRILELTPGRQVAWTREFRLAVNVEDVHLGLKSNMGPFDGDMQCVLPIMTSVIR